MRRIATLLGINRARVTQRLKAAGIEPPRRGAGRARPHVRLPSPPNLCALLERLYLEERLTAREISKRIEMSEKAVQDRLRDCGIAMRTRGWANREDRVSPPIEEVERLYLGLELPAEEVGRRLGCSRGIVLRVAHEQGWPVRLGGPVSDQDPAEIELIQALYADAQVSEVLKRHGVPEVAAGAPIHERFPTPFGLSPDLLRELYSDCGVAGSHIELLTGQPRTTVTRALVAAGVMLRPSGGRTPFVRRWRASGRGVRGRSGAP